MLKQIGISVILLGTVPLGLIAQEAPNPIQNQQIDSETFLQHVTESHRIRENRRLSEQDFIEMAKDPDTIILDARSADRFEQMHIQGAQSLSFTEFTAETLGAIIPSKATRILIYCNNNIVDSPIAFAMKAPPASLNLSTYTSLYTYGYTHVYELGPVVNPQTSQLKFEGTLSSETSKSQKRQVLAIE